MLAACYLPRRPGGCGQAPEFVAHASEPCLAATSSDVVVRGKARECLGAHGLRALGEVVARACVRGACAAGRRVWRRGVGG